MKFSNTSMLLLLSAAAQFATMFASAETQMRGGLRKTASMNLQRRQEEDVEEAEEAEAQYDDYAYYDDSTSSMSGSYIAATKCNSYKVEEDEDSVVDMALKWNKAYGNQLDVFTVPQKSYVFYDVVDPYNYRSSNRNRYDNYVQVNGNDNVDASAAFKRSSTSYIIDLDYWIQTGATLELGKQAGPSCQQIYNPQEVFKYNSDNDDIAKYLATAGLKYNKYFEDWEPKLYLGPICGMGDGTLNWGIFLDDTCTTYVPKWTYRYRKEVAKGHISYDADHKTLAKLNTYTTPKEETSGLFNKEHHWSCGKSNALCETLLSYSADTLYCQAQGEEEEEEDKDRRRLEDAEEAEDEEEEEQEDEQEEEEEEEEEANDDDYAKYVAYASDDYFSNGYQLSQDDMENIEDACGAVVASLQNKEGTLEGYLKKNKQLQQSTKDYKRQTRSAVEFTILALMLFAVVVFSALFIRKRKRRKRVRQVKIVKKGDDKTEKLVEDSSEAAQKDTTTTNSAGKKKSSQKQQKKAKPTKERGGWFRRKSKNQNVDKTRSLLDKR